MSILPSTPPTDKIEPHYVECPTCHGYGDWQDPETGKFFNCPTCNGACVIQVYQPVEAQS